MLKLLSGLVLPVALSACVTTSGTFTKGMEEPLAKLKKAAAVADDAESDLLKSYSVGLLENLAPSAKIDPLIVCKPFSGPSAASQNLAVFSDAVDTVKKVGEAPTDTSYTGYITRFRENAKSGEPRSPADEQVDAEKNAKEARDKCTKLFTADSREVAQLRQDSVGLKNATPAVIGLVLGVDALAKGILKQAEAAQREWATRATIEKLIPQLTKAKAALMSLAKDDPSAENSQFYGAMVDYGRDPVPEDPQLMESLEIARKQNQTKLGATVTIRRWYVAQQIVQQWSFLSPCRVNKGKGCLADPATQQVVLSFVANVKAYRALSAVDPEKVGKALDASLDAAQKALKPEVGISQLIDGLIGLSDAIKDLSDAYDTYDKSKG